MEKVRRAVAIEVESPPLELQTAARLVYHPGGGVGGEASSVSWRGPSRHRAAGWLCVSTPPQGVRPTLRTRQDVCSVWSEASTGHRGVAPKVSVQSLLYPPRGAGRLSSRPPRGGRRSTRHNGGIKYSLMRLDLSGWQLCIVSFDVLPQVWRPQVAPQDGRHRLAAVRT
jgi:hypothetical protein